MIPEGYRLNPKWVLEAFSRVIFWVGSIITVISIISGEGYSLFIIGVGLLYFWLLLIAYGMSKYDNFDIQIAQ